MKKIIMLAFSVLMLAIGTMSAQQNGERSEGREGRGQRGPSPEYVAMIDSLGLDADQKIQFDAMETMFREKSQKEMKAARESGEERQAIRAKANKLQEEQLAVLKNLFTEDQYAMYSDFMKKQQAAQKGRRGGRRG